MGVIPIVPAQRAAPADIAATCGPGRSACRRCRRCRSTCTFRGACASAPTATSIRTSRDGAAAIPETRVPARAASPTSKSALPLIWGRRDHQRVHRRRHAQPVLARAAIDTLLSDVRALLPLGAGCEITLEANPGTVEAGRFAAFRAAGVNRLSLGIQSFDDAASCRRSGRIHDRHAGAGARSRSRSATFDNFNLDLMYGLPRPDARARRRPTSTRRSRSRRRTCRSIS